MLSWAELCWAELSWANIISSAHSSYKSHFQRATEHKTIFWRCGTFGYIWKNNRCKIGMFVLPGNILKMKTVTLNNPQKPKWRGQGQGHGSVHVTLWRLRPSSMTICTLLTLWKLLDDLWVLVRKHPRPPTCYTDMVKWLHNSQWCYNTNITYWTKNYEYSWSISYSDLLWNDSCQGITVESSWFTLSQSCIWVSLYFATGDNSVPFVFLQEDTE
jgi:hypothetical protein